MSKAVGPLLEEERVKKVLDLLSEQQRKIAELVIEGLKVSKIAKQLNLKPQNVRNQIKRIAAKIEYKNRNEKGPGAEPALFTEDEKVDLQELLFSLSGQQRRIAELIINGHPAKEIPKLLGITRDALRSNISRLRKKLRAEKKKKVAFRQTIGPGQRRLPEMTAEELLKQLQQDPGRVAILFRRYACAEKGDPEFEVALLTAGADRDRLWRQRGKLQKIMAAQGKEGRVLLKLTSEEAREIRDCLEYMGKHPVLVDPVEKTVTYILTGSEAARLGLECTSAWKKKLREEARRMAG